MRDIPWLARKKTMADTKMTGRVCKLSDCKLVSSDIAQTQP